ncbi:MAG: DUF937 domain-containing protein [Lautropia sp.]|nr:DUF937 domain-containing protein [Lautropia sp.]
MSQQQDLTQQLMSQLQGAPMQQIAQKLGTDTNQANSAVSQALPMLMNALGNQSQGGLSSILSSLGGAGGLAGMLGGLLGGGQGNAQQGGSAGGLGDILGNVLGGGNNAQQGGNAGGLGDMLGGALGGGAGQQQAPGQFGQAQGQQAQPGTQPANVPAQDDDGLLGNIFGQERSTATSELGQASGLGSDGARKLLATLAPIVIAFLGARYMLGRNDDNNANQAAPAGNNDEGGLMGGARDSGAALRGMLDQTGDGKLDMNDIVKLGSSLFGGKR